ncbi:MAG: hypothetical protein NTV79_03235 [Candidatus Aureabacteria bacterium]|nr:hypothetical protein [Candidatus Auribacterota bacterium]
MGFFGKLVNFVTGGGAKVALEAVEPSRSGPVRGKVHASIEATDLETQGVFLKVAGIEVVRVKDVEVARKTGDKIEMVKEDVERTAATYEQKIQVAPSQRLAAKTEHDWEATVTLPPGALPTYRGSNAKHEWKILAEIEVPGNNPDSGWVVLDMV